MIKKHYFISASGINYFKTFQALQDRVYKLVLADDNNQIKILYCYSLQYMKMKHLWRRSFYSFTCIQIITNDKTGKSGTSLIVKTN